MPAFTKKDPIFIQTKDGVIDYSGIPGRVLLYMIPLTYHVGEGSDRYRVCFQLCVPSVMMVWMEGDFSKSMNVTALDTGAPGVTLESKTAAAIANAMQQRLDEEITKR